MISDFYTSVFSCAAEVKPRHVRATSGWVTLKELTKQPTPPLAGTLNYGTLPLLEMKPLASCRLAR